MVKTARGFKHYPLRPKKLTSGFASKEYAVLLMELEVAEASSSPRLWLRLFKKWNELKSYVGSEGSRISYQYSQDMHNKQIEEQEKYFREKVIPVIEEPEHLLTKAFLASKHRADIAEKYGQQLVPLYETDVRPSDPINTIPRIEAGKLGKRYEKKIAGAQVVVQGKKITLWKSRSYYESPEESVRKEAFLANRGWFLSHHEELSSMYGQLVSLRHEMARNVGYKNYIPYAYEALGRTDYDASRVRNFRQNVKKYAVPLNRQLATKKAEALGKKLLKPWDSYDPSTTLPLGVVPVDTQLQKAQIMFDELSPKLGAHFAHMRKNNLIDLENRAGKRAGAYCTEFSDEQKVLIFCNSTGEAEDIETLTHEMGHAFQGWESQHIEAVDLQWGTLDLCEIYSTGMEFLSMPYLNNFMSEQNSNKFRLGRWEKAISTLCYVSVVDEFQHWVYENPGATATERDERWCLIAEDYSPVVDHSGYEQYRKARWYGQAHIFVSPFYYIDYALAETCAIQLALLATNDHSKALKTYIKMCRIGGTKSFLEAVEYGGMRSPFDSSLMKELMEYAARETGL